jgi:kynurenine formamidase
MNTAQVGPRSWFISVPPVKGRLVDLSLGIFDGAPNYPALPPTEVVVTNTIANDHMNATKLVISTHGTTHLDVPYHFIDGGKTVEQLDLEKCIGPARVVDFTGKGQKAAVDVGDLEAHAGVFVPGARVLLRFGWDKVYPGPAYFSDHPYLTIGAANWLASRQIAMLGMDSPTPTPTDWIEVHTILLRAEIVLVEALAHLDQLPAGEFFFMAAPLLILGRDGAPVRALAIV